VVTLRCTRKLLRRLRIDPPQSHSAPTTALGDWHVNLLLWRPQLIHCMNDRSLLSVLLPARDSATFPSRLKPALRQLLLRLGVSPEAADSEVGEMNEVVFAPTSNRSILGCMRDAELALAYDVDAGHYSTLDELQWRLTEHIHEPTGYRHPGEFAAELLSTVAHA
jgi:hypothetical protein